MEKNWLWEILEDAEAEVAKWPEGMRRYPSKDENQKDDSE